MIELENISLGYDGKVVLRKVNLEAEQGEIVGLIGPNASGKSTLIKGVSRLIRLFAGRILIGGKDITTIKREDLACLVATVPQNPSLPRTFTAFELVLMGRTPHLGRLRSEGKKDMAIAWQAMKNTRTQHLAERKVGELSGGEKQRLVIARALTQQPKVLLLDEPTASLDINHQIETLKLVKELSHQKALTVIAAHHDLNLAAQHCDWLALLKEGEIYTQGVPEEVVTTKNIKEVYGAEARVYSHPVNELPLTIITLDES